jgi:hypothetical protein
MAAVDSVFAARSAGAGTGELLLMRLACRGTNMQAEDSLLVALIDVPPERQQQALVAVALPGLPMDRNKRRSVEVGNTVLKLMKMWGAGRPCYSITVLRCCVKVCIYIER